MTSFQSLAFRKKKTRAIDSVEHQKSLANEGHSNVTDINIKLATLVRKKWITVSTIFFTTSLIFLILTIIGNTSNRRLIRSTYFLKLNLANIIPASTPGDIILVNSLARSLGLHDFYQVGIWNFCEGYNNEGVTFCSKPKSRFWFNPVEILLQELLSGATIALPADINKILHLIKLASSVMFSFFIAGACMNFVSIFVAPITLYSRWWSLPFFVWTFFSMLFTTIATVIVTAMSIIFVNVATSQPGLNIGANIGKPFFIFMWIATAFNILGTMIHLCLMYCCASRRDIVTGKKTGDRNAYGSIVTGEKRSLPTPYLKKYLSKMPKFRNKRTVEVS
ncbi:SUR7 family protein pun1 [Erysiphe necator]|uniref:Putative integral membrane protein n=1 Tax=Uncinula necator TaxID=52586 RepID=A0A0B1P158_UNCNE|nr:SUR7 family protein pun1 [Erysiphe necator]KHJ31030.1 putative integral membrane protein [Erysiphe necator]